MCIKYNNFILEANNKKSNIFILCGGVWKIFVEYIKGLEPPPI